MFGSVTVVRFGCREPASSSFIELMPARLRRAVLNGQELDPETLRANRLPLARLRDVNELRVEADMAYSRGGAGLHRFTDPADGETYLALQARKAWPPSRSPPRCAGCWPTSSTTCAAPCGSARARPSRLGGICWFSRLSFLAWRALYSGSMGRCTSSNKYNGPSFMLGPPGGGC